MFGKNVLIAGSYQRIELTKEEIDSAMKELMDYNVKELERIIEKAKNTGVTATINQNAFIQMMFEKQGRAAYTILVAKLDDKIEQLRKTFK
jgi:hypothetical protein